jgi:Mlc titration factor MtfA (ptsG expression regulator)
MPQNRTTIEICYFCLYTSNQTMDFIYQLCLILLILAILFTPMFGLHYLVKYLWNTFVEKPDKYYRSNIDVQSIETVLLGKFAYYQKLDPIEKERFVKRVNVFIAHKEFLPSGGMEITDEMVILIASSAVQLTFGLEDYLLLSFSKIFIYPKEYYSQYDKLYHQGEANLGGVVVLSWNNFLEGYNKPHDNYNLGLHEMAHALRFDKFKNIDSDDFFSVYFEKWYVVAREEFLRLKNSEPSFFRKYGGTNINEFFSVCVEYFFESSKEFQNIHPEIYKHLSILLNQDPLTNQYQKLPTL